MGKKGQYKSFVSQKYSAQIHILLNTMIHKGVLGMLFAWEKELKTKIKVQKTVLGLNSH